MTVFGDDDDDDVLLTLPDLTELRDDDVADAFGDDAVVSILFRDFCAKLIMAFISLSSTGVVGFAEDATAGV